MDIVKRYILPYNGIKEGHHSFNYEVDNDFFGCFENSEIRSGDASVEIDVLRAKTMLTLRVKIMGEVVVECDRCLEDCPVKVDYEGTLIVKFSDEVSEYDGEVMWIPSQSGEVALGQYIYESIVLSLPYQRVHDEGECNTALLNRFQNVTQQKFD